MIDYSQLIRTRQVQAAQAAQATTSVKATPRAVPAPVDNSKVKSFVATLQTGTCKIKYRKADKTLVDMTITLQQKHIPASSTGTSRILPDGQFSAWSIDRSGWRTLKYSSIEEIHLVAEQTTAPAQAPSFELSLTHAQQIALFYFINNMVHPALATAGQDNTVNVAFAKTKSGYTVAEKITGLKIDL